MGAFDGSYSVSNLWYLLGCLVEQRGVVNKKKVAYIAGCCCLFLRLS